MSSSTRIAAFRIPICCVVVAALSACGHEQVRRVPTTASTAETSVRIPKVQRRHAGEQAAVVASRQLGVPYQYGGTDTEGFDCSGLVHFAYANVGKRIPRTTAEQWRQLSPVSNKNMRVGDLLFFRIDGKISHVGMYLGNRRFVHAPSTGRNVTTASLDSDYYRRAFVRAGRPD
jgi:cell wall-associated NlpC family hydrolase